MKSLRNSASQAGITDAPLSVRAVGRRVGIAPPLSVKQLIDRLEHPPLEEAKFRQAIVTGGLAALGGFVELTLRNDGTYKIHFHLHDSGVPDYKFQVRAAFAAANGLMFAWQNSGKVEGTESTTLTHEPRRNHEAEFAGTHPLIKQHWPDVKAGKLAVTKEYSAAGTVGFVQDLAKTAAGLAADAAHSAAGAAAGAVIALGDEMQSVIRTLPLGGDIGVIAGVVVLSFGGGVILATIAGIEAGAVTAAAIQKRPLHLDEYEWAKKNVFGDARNNLAPMEKIWLTNVRSFQDRAITLPGPSGTIYLNVGTDCMNRPMAHTDDHYPIPGQLFIHEMVHGWQIHHSAFVPGWLCEGAVLQARNSLDKSVYKYGSAGPAWGEFNIEQQAAIVDQWFGGTRKGKGPDGKWINTQMNPRDDYYPYIRDNIQKGRT